MPHDLMQDGAAVPHVRPGCPKLSICITTFNRAGFLPATLDSIVAQAAPDVEIIVLDGASTDATQEVMSGYEKRFHCVRFVRQAMNSGIDRDYDRVVCLARGEYCWLMTDDDFLKPGAVLAIIEVLQESPSAVIVNAEVRDFSMARVLQRRWIDFDEDRVYGPNEMDRLFVEVGDILKYIGGFIIRRSIWLASDRERYYGSLFIYLAVMFQRPLPGDVRVIAEPFISYRMSNSHTFTALENEITFKKWPALVRSLPISEQARRCVRSTEPWKHAIWMMELRATGYYSKQEYRLWIRPCLCSFRGRFVPLLVALIPGVIMNTAFVLYYLVRRDRSARLQMMKDSPYYLGNYGRFLSVANARRR